MSARKSSFLGKLVNLLLFAILLTACAGDAQPEPTSQANTTGCPYKLPWSASLGSILVTQGYAEPGNASHTAGSGMEYAIDFALAGETPVLAARAGIVSKIHDGETAYGGSEYANKANFVIIDHGDGTYAIYMHLEKTVFTQADEGKTKVAQGQIIGYSGRTGWTNGHFHLHFQLQNVGDGFGQSIPLCFMEADNGVPQLNKSYVSLNGTGVVLGISVTATVSPTKTFVPTSLPNDWWPDSLIGTWKGDASCRFHSGPYQDCPIITVKFQIQRKGDGHLVANDLIRLDVPQAPQGEHQAMLDEDNLFYCFTINMGAFCFYPVNENTLDYIGGSMDYSEKGTLTRVK